jgi:hypothetical protein
MLLVIRMFGVMLGMMFCMKLVSMRHVGVVRRQVMIVGVVSLVRLSMMMRGCFKMCGSLLMVIMF